MSPYQDENGTLPSKAEKKAKREQPPRAFSPFDKIIVGVGIQLACDRFLKDKG
jgi:hypothetical protein